ncbi:MAG: pyridoxamine 5'-phosphate oxidase family protein [Clostridiales bacterium]|nr:pyridoxamine 5'-phosphate oxidase family protein [Clostridiales bacterium]
MFREMRRKKQEIPQEESSEILRTGKTGILGVSGEDGYPYTVPVNYVYLDGKIYFHGAKTGHKMDAIKSCDKVSFCVIEKDDIVPEEMTTYFKSVVVFGRARILETDAEIRQAVKWLGLKYNKDEAFVDSEIEREWNSLSCVEVTIEHMTGKEASELTDMRKAKH